jgi:hypothetical protein
LCKKGGNLIQYVEYKISFFVIIVFLLTDGGTDNYVNDDKFKELAEKLTFDEFTKLEYYVYSKDFSLNWMRYSDSGKFYRLKKMYYSSKKELIEYLDDQEVKIKNILSEKHIDDNVDFNELVIKLFSNEFTDEEEYLKYNLLGYKISLHKTIEEFKRDIENNYYLVDSTENMLEFIEKLIFDFNSIYTKNCSRRKRVMPGMELLPVYEETIKGYLTSDFAKPATSIFILRQIIEVKIKRTLGISCVKNANTGENKIVNISILLKYIKEKENMKEIISPVDIDMLVAINKATNQYIHTGNFYNIMSWHEKIGQIVLKELCFKRNTQQQTHIEGNFIILKSLYDNLENDLKAFLFPKNASNIQIQLFEAEATIVEQL